MWNFFDRKVCLTLDGSPMLKNEAEAEAAKLEWRQAQMNFSRVGLTDVLKFSALKEIGGHQSFNRSTRQILIDFWESGSRRLLFLEEDVEFAGLAHLEKALAELPEDFDICYLGGNVSEENFIKPEKYATHLCRVFNCWTTHSVCYNREVIPWILENQPGFSVQMFDNWISSRLGELKAFIVNPMVAVQRSRVSTIWNTYCDYTEKFEASNKKMEPV